jgi:hypothetical protein
MSENKLENAEVKKSVEYVKPSQLKGGEIFEGIFTRTHEVPSIFDDNKTMSTHYIEADNVVYGINGTAQLDALMKKREPGKRIKIEYIGKKTIVRKNGKSAETHDFNTQNG